MVVAVPPHFQQVYHCESDSIALVAPQMKQVIIATFRSRPATSSGSEDSGLLIPPFPSGFPWPSHFFHSFSSDIPVPFSFDCPLIAAVPSTAS